MSVFYSVRIDDIPHDGFRLATQWDGAALEEIPGDASRAFHIAAPLELELEFHLPGSQVIMEGFVTTALETACVRCLKEFVLPLDIRFRYVFRPLSKEAPAQEMELRTEEIELQYYKEGEPVDLRPLIAEQLCLHMPQYPHCAESCKGLCPSCGANLNETACSCAAGLRSGEFSPFSVLKKLKQ